MANQNPSNSSIIQYLLDMRGDDIGLSDDGKKAVQTLLKALQSNQALAKVIDDKYRKHDVPEQNITYTQDANIRKSIAFLGLSGIDEKVFHLLRASMSKDGLVKYNRDQMAEMLNISNSTLKRSIKTLVSNGFIAYFKDPNGGRGHPVFMINPQESFIGVNRSNKEMESKFSKLAGDTYKAYNEIKEKYSQYTQGYETYQKPMSEGDNKIYKIGVIQIQTKKESVSSTTDPQDNMLPDGINDPSLPFNN